MLKVIISLGILALVWAAPQDVASDDMDSVIESIFGKLVQKTTTDNPDNNNLPSTIVPPVEEKNIKIGTGLRCRIANGVDGVCTPYYLCHINNTLINYEVDVNNPSVQDACEFSLDVCCNLAYIISDLTTPKIASAQDMTTDLDAVMESLFGKTDQKTVLPVEEKNTETRTGSTCSIANGVDGVCTPYYLCHINNTLITDETAANNTSAEEDECALLDVCCKPEYITDDVTLPKLDAKIATGDKCETAKGGDGVCTIYYLCHSNNTLLTDGGTYTSVQHECASSLDVCCNSAYVISEPTTQKTVTKIATGVKCDTGIGVDGICVPYYQCQSNNNSLMDSFNTSRHDARCELTWDVCCTQFVREDPTVLDIDI